jgi:hypothetical protein
MRALPFLVFQAARRGSPMPQEGAMSKPKPPASLKTAGQLLWSAVVAKYDLRADELAVLEGACRAKDMVAGLESAWVEAGSPLYTKGSMGQLVEHPAPKSIRSWQSALDAALARLKLPDEVSGAVTTNPARAAAASRWKHGS